MALGKNMRGHKPAPPKTIVEEVLGESQPVGIGDIIINEEAKSPVLEDLATQTSEDESVVEENNWGQIVITPSDKEGDSTASISMEGVLNINWMSKAKESLLGAISEFDTVLVSFNNILDVDLACVQLLIALKNTGEKLGKQVEINMEMPEDLKVMLGRSGFDKI